MEIFLSNWIFWLVISYLSGTICFAYWYGKLNGINILEVGSKSATSTNLSRELGLAWGLASGVSDVFKAFLPVLFAQAYISGWQLALVAVAPMIGHIFPLWYKGGKGGACFIGSGLALVNFGFFIPLGLFFLTIYISKKTSTANLLHPFIFLACAFVLGWGTEAIIFGIIATVLLWYGLRENIQRILSGNEPDLTKKL